MIVIKTDMKELPKNCMCCENHIALWNGTEIGINYCQTKRLTENQVIKARPSWCPLMEITNKQLLALRAVINGCNTNTKLRHCDYMIFDKKTRIPEERMSYAEAINIAVDLINKLTEAKDEKHI